MPSLSSVALSLAIIGAGYLNALCATPPNPPPPQSRAYKLDRIHFLTDNFPRFIKNVSWILYIYHALLALFWPSSAQDATTLNRICPHPSNLDSEFYTWNSFTITHLILIYVGSAIRLSAYGSLGKNFTFQLAAPDRLVTSGVYRFIQHPSYTGQFLIILATSFMFLRWDASLACVISESLLQGTLSGLGRLIEAPSVIVAIWALFARVRDEEGMLKEKFGQEWVRWHERTKRFIPFVV